MHAVDVAVGIYHCSHCNCSWLPVVGAMWKLVKAGLAGQRQRQASDNCSVGSSASAKRRRRADSQEHSSERVNSEVFDPQCHGNLG